MPILHPDDPAIASLKGLHVYHAGISNCSMRVRLLAEEKGLAWTSHEIDLGRQENLEDWYLAINPKGLVPAIVHDGVVVTESDDILAYLEATFPEPAFAPADPDARAEMERWVRLASEMHMDAVKTYVYGMTGGASKTAKMMERYEGLVADKKLQEFHRKSLDGFTAEEVEAAAALLRGLFEQMEAALAGHRYLVGDDYTLADIAWLPQHVLLRIIGFDLTPYPNVNAWAARLADRPAYDRAIRAWMPRLPGWLMRPMLQGRRLLRRVGIRV